MTRRGGLALRVMTAAAASAAISVSCSTTSPVADAGVEAGPPCATNADCPSGTECVYPVADGCSATLHCLAKSQPGACKSMCACDRSQLIVCGAGAPKPIWPGVCDVGPDASLGCSSALACEQCDVTGYTPPRMGSPRTSVGACTQQQLQDFVTACFGSTATAKTCNVWELQDSGACATCLTPVLKSAASWGPFACSTSNTPCALNSGGCVDLALQATSEETNTGGPGSCGDLVTTSLGCQDYACIACSATDLQTCDQSAIANECANYVAQVDSTTGACAPIHGDAAPLAVSKCFPQSDADNVAFVNVFCGTGP